ncbi:MAG: penicillin acylase family protein [Chitinophagales bacterium]
MKKIGFFLSTIITISSIVLLSISFKGMPAIGKLLNPTTGFWQNAEGKKFILPSVISEESIEKKVEIYFDERKIPHIFAETERDLYFAQGYVIASLRLWQMEFQVMAADGRLSEIIGEKTIEFDKSQRRLGLNFGARNKLKAIEKDKLASELLQAYTDGVNAYIENLAPKDYPLEYKLMDYKPELWSNYKTALVLMNMSNILASAGDDIENSNFVAKYGKELQDKLYPKFINLEPVIPTPKNGWFKTSNDTTTTIKDEKIVTALNTENKTLDRIKDPKKYHIGSNNWAISGAKSKSGFPILCNDPHLKFSLPSVWIEMHLSGPMSNAYGVTFPGSPGIVIGFNDNIGWGVTNSGRDVKDFYTVEYKDATKELYHYQNQWVKSEFVVEEIKVKGKNSVLDTVIYTKFGPIQFEDFETQTGKKDIAIQWMAHKASKESLMFYHLNRAKNFDEFVEATKYFDCPAQNIIFASINGDIALRNQGKFPINNYEQGDYLQTSNEGKVWEDFIPFEHNPMQYNPERGFVASANQESVDSTYPYYINGGFENYRNRVINSKLTNLKDATVAEMKALQANNFNLKAAESLPLMLKYVNTSNLDFEEQAVYNLLNTWKFVNDKESKAAVFYEEFFNKYYSSLWDEFDEAFIPPSEAQTIYLLKDSTKHQFIDNKTTALIEDQKALINKAFKYTASKSKEFEKVNWGKYNDLNFEHLARIPAFSKAIEYGGNNHIVNATRKQWGASWRMILDFDQGKINGIGVYPGGQSGNPGSAQYDDMIAEWAKGEYHKLQISKNKADYKNENFTKVALIPNIK